MISYFYKEEWGSKYVIMNARTNSKLRFSAIDRPIGITVYFRIGSHRRIVY